VTLALQRSTTTRPIKPRNQSLKSTARVTLFSNWQNDNRPKPINFGHLFDRLGLQVPYQIDFQIHWKTTWFLYFDSWFFSSLDQKKMPAFKPLPHSLHTCTNGRYRLRYTKALSIEITSNLGTRNLFCFLFFGWDHLNNDMAGSQNQNLAPDQMCASWSISSCNRFQRWHFPSQPYSIQFCLYYFIKTIL